MWRMPRGEHDDKRALERELGLSLWAERTTSGLRGVPMTRLPHPRGMPSAQPRGRILFAAREAIVDNARAADHEAWFGRGGKTSCLGLLPPQETDRFVLEPQLVMRLVQEPNMDVDAAVVVPARTRWRCAGTLAQSGAAATRDR
jgi:hypothetical protein